MPDSDYLLGSIWFEGQKSGRVENGEKMEKWKDGKDFNFPHFYLVKSGKIERWKK